MTVKFAAPRRVVIQEERLEQRCRDEGSRGYIQAVFMLSAGSVPQSKFLMKVGSMAVLCRLLSSGFTREHIRQF